MRRLIILSLLISLTTFSGCRICCWGKRASEKKCPTDIRKTHFWCFGEDAIFDYPCGPARQYYGHKPTCWREWPSPGSQWRDVHCGSIIDETAEYYVTPSAPQGEPTLPTPVPETANPPQDSLLPSAIPEDAPDMQPVVPPPSDEHGLESAPIQPGVEQPPTDPATNPASGADDWQHSNHQYRQARFSNRFPVQTAQAPPRSEHIQESPEDQTSAALQRYMSDDADAAP